MMNSLLTVAFVFSLVTSPVVRAATNNVIAYGAVPDDGVCDADEIQAAIDDSGAGDVVYLPDGTFNLNANIQLDGGVYLVGAGDASGETMLLGLLS